MEALKSRTKKKVKKTSKRANFGVGYLEKGVFTLVLGLESYPGTVPGHQVWTLPKTANLQLDFAYLGSSIPQLIFDFH